MSDPSTSSLNYWDRQLLAAAWDAAVAAMVNEDGTPVELVANINPYRKQAPNE